MIWTLDFPETPVLPNSYFWTWDHSTNWVLDDPGLQTAGCYNPYFKKPETFIEDYRRLTDLAAGLGVKGVLIWGFLRDAHGGVEAGKRVAEYAASKGVSIMPGIGTTWYGGCYYEGDHPANMERFLRENPDAQLLNPEYDVYSRGICPTHPKFVDWMTETVQWLFDEFEIGGANLENGDYVVCQEERCKAHKASWPESDHEVFRMQCLGYDAPLRAIEERLREKLVTCATYSGFVPGNPPEEFKDSWAWMHCEHPVMLDRLPPEGVVQWTLTGMVRQKPLPLTAWLDDGAPGEVYNNPAWLKGLRSPAKRAVGFLHQGSQWSGGRYSQVISTIKEGCLRAHESGLEGVSIHGEVTSRCIPNALNYLAFAHFIRKPEDTLRGFARETLGQVMGDAGEAEEYIECLAHCDAGSLDEGRRESMARRLRQHAASPTGGGRQDGPWGYWNWLNEMACVHSDWRTPGFF